MSGYLILIIDDDPTQHLILGDYLKLAGYDVIHADNGEKGLEILERKRPDLVLLDVQMPGMDGFELLKKMRKNAANRNISVLILTALDRRHLKIKGLELGADDYITKPFDRAELLARINAVLRRSDRHRTLDGVMEGDLSDVGISDLLQSMELGMKTATIHLKEVDGVIVIKNGELLKIRQGQFKGEQALLRIFLLEKGYFTIQFHDVPADENAPTQALTSILMNVANEVDEIRDIVRQLGVQHRRIKFKGDLSEFPELEKVKQITPATLTEIITYMPGDPRKNIHIMVAASKKKKLSIEKKS